MRNLSISINRIVLLAMLCSLFACKKSFLEVKPKGKLIAEKTSDYFLLYNSILSTIPSETIMWMADDVTALEPSYSGTTATMKRFYTWEDDLYLETEGAGMISLALTNLYAMNKIINETMASTGGTDQQKKSLIAEARVYRAWQHFMFVNYYGKPYNEATAATDPGFPILTTSDLTKTEFIRMSVKDVYNFVQKELTEAIPDLPAKATFRSRMSSAAGKAYLAKVYLYMGKYADALPYLEDAVSEAKTAAIPVQLFDYNVEAVAGGVFAPSLYGPGEISYNNDKESLNWWGRGIQSNMIFLSPTYFIPKEIQDQYTASDKRKVFFADRNFLAPTAFKGGLKRLQSKTSTNHNGANMPDIYLMLAECQVRTDDLTGAIATLQYFREHRMNITDAKVSTSILKDDLVRAIIEERKLEFVGMGDRWNTIRRLSNDPLFPGITNFKHIIYNADATIKEEITFPAKRLVMRLPLKVMLQNPDMEQNP